jgi:hypothetical protein
MVAGMIAERPREEERNGSQGPTVSLGVTAQLARPVHELAAKGLRRM